MSTYPGLPATLFKFMDQLKRNNNRDWFNENKEHYYTDVADPVCDFIEAMAPDLAAISDHYIADSRSHGGSMFRIYRHARFSKKPRKHSPSSTCLNF